MKHLNRIWIFAKVSSAVLALAIISQSCTNEISDVDELTAKVNADRDIGENITIYYSDSARLRLILESPYMERLNNPSEPNEIFKGGVKLSFINSEKTEAGWLFCDELIRKPRQKIMIAKGNAMVINTDGEKLQSPEIIFEENTKKIHSEKFVRITRPLLGDTLYGIGFQTDDKFKELEIKRKVQGKLNTDKINRAIDSGNP
jgi:hypothetical protein